MIAAVLAVGDCIAQPNVRPNIVVVLIDDMGWGDLSCFGNKSAATPNIDRLAAEGLRFEQFYVNAPICSPSRTAISTGQYPQRWRIGSYLADRRLNDERGIARGDHRRRCWPGCSMMRLRDRALWQVAHGRAA
jgi:hypothetical protein